MLRDSETGVSVIELLVATAIIATVSAALLPAIALAARLQRESAIEVEASLIAARRLEMLKAEIAAGLAAAGPEFLDRSGAAVPIGVAAYECTWSIEAAPGPPGLSRIAVRVAGLGDETAVVITTVVPDG